MPLLLKWKKVSLCLSMATLLFALAACRDRAEPAHSKNNNGHVGASDMEDAEASPAPFESDEDKLLVIKAIPLGISYEDVKGRLPEVGEMSVEGYSEYTHRQGLAKAFADVSVLGRDGVLEFNFENNKLYSYYYRVPNLDRGAGADLYRHVQEFYAGRFGKPREEERREGAQVARSSFWSADTFHVVLAEGSQADPSTVSWGFQSEQP